MTKSPALLALLMSVVAATAAAAPNVTVGNVSGQAGGTVTLPVTFDPTTNSVAGIQFDLTVPAGLTLGAVTTGAILTAAGKSVTGNLSGNTWSVIIFGVNQGTIPSGSLFTVQLAIAAGTPNGTLNLPLSNVVYSDPSGTNVAGGAAVGGVITVSPLPPVITSANTAVGQVGVAFNYQTTASNNPISFSATTLPAGLSISAANGLISGTPTASGTTNVTLGATNAGGTGNQTLALTFNPATPAVTSAGSGIAQVGTAFSYQITASNNPASFGATGLPAGLTLNSATGLITGTPSAQGTASISLSATNAGGTGTKTLSLTVNPAIPVITSMAAATGIVGTAFSYQITATNSPSSYAATSLAAGLALNTATGLISGTPATAGTYSIGLRAINAGGTGAKTLTLTVNPLTPMITSTGTLSAHQWSPVTYQITATNNPTSFAASGLPSGLTLNTATGLISGTPSVYGTFPISLSAVNAGGTGTSALALGVTSACDLNSDQTVNIFDIQLIVNQSIHIASCTSDINQDGLCNILDVQKVVNAALLNGLCVSP